MEAYFIGVLMSSMPYLLLTLMTTVLFIFLRKNYAVPSWWKTLIVLSLLSLGYGAIQPSNTYKHEAPKMPKPVVQMSDREIVEIVPLSERGKEERAKRFENQVDWRNK